MSIIDEMHRKYQQRSNPGPIPADANKSVLVNLTENELGLLERLSEKTGTSVPRVARHFVVNEVQRNTVVQMPGDHKAACVQVWLTQNDYQKLSSLIRKTLGNEADWAASIINQAINCDYTPIFRLSADERNFCLHLTEEIANLKGSQQFPQGLERSVIQIVKFLNQQGASWPDVSDMLWRWATESKDLEMTFIQYLKSLVAPKPPEPEDAEETVAETPTEPVVEETTDDPEDDEADPSNDELGQYTPSETQWAVIQQLLDHHNMSHEEFLAYAVSLAVRELFDDAI